MSWTDELILAKFISEIDEVSDTWPNFKFYSTKKVYKINYQLKEKIDEKKNYFQFQLYNGKVNSDNNAKNFSKYIHVVKHK